MLSFITPVGLGGKFVCLVSNPGSKPLFSQKPAVIVTYVAENTG